MREQTDIDPILEQLGIAYLADRVLEYGKDTLSGGEKQKISLARALAGNAPLLILDEPGNNLDTRTLEWLADWIRSSDKTILYISHDPVLTAAADRCIALGK
ncbi:MAG: ATP-binding cassette domain-containing protein [Clostridia bacterium]|nr:ATP-binding cassette domain-containing protein [Clostridia bacterium]